MLLIVVLAVVVVIVVIGGITGQISDISHLSDAKSTIEGWLKDLGVDAGTARAPQRMLAPRARARSNPAGGSRRASSRSRRSSSSCP